MDGVALHCAASALQSMPSEAVVLMCPRPGTGEGEMVEGKIVGKNENNILVVRSAYGSG